MTSWLVARNRGSISIPSGSETDTHSSNSSSPCLPTVSAPISQPKYTRSVSAMQLGGPTTSSGPPLGDEAKQPRASTGGWQTTTILKSKQREHRSQHLRLTVPAPAPPPPPPLPHSDWESNSQTNDSTPGGCYSSSSSSSQSFSSSTTTSSTRTCGTDSLTTPYQSPEHSFSSSADASPNLRCITPCSLDRVSTPTQAPLSPSLSHCSGDGGLLLLPVVAPRPMTPPMPTTFTPSHSHSPSPSPSPLPSPSHSPLPSPSPSPSLQPPVAMAPQPPVSIAPQPPLSVSPQPPASLSTHPTVMCNYSPSATPLLNAPVSPSPQPPVSSSPQPISMYQAVPSAVATPPIEPGFIPAVHPQLEAMTKSSAVMINLAAGEGIFNTLPTRTTIFLSGQQRAHTSSGGVLSVTFTQPFPSTPKVLAWLFGYSNEAPFSAVPTSKILASSTGFTAAVEGNSEMCWIAFATPVTAPALKDAVGFIQASPRGLNKQLVEKVEASIKEGTINAKGNTGLTLLHVASYSGNSELVSYLLDKGAKIDPKDYLGITPLLAAISSGNFDVANLLIEKGAKTLHRAKRGQTALHFLAKSFKADSSSSQLLSTLLVSKIDVNAQTDTGDTALMMACTAPELHLDFISSLIFAEANPCIENNNGESPITKAKASGNIKLIDAISRPTSMCNPQNEKPTQNEQRISLPESLSPPSTVVALELVWSVFQKIGPTASLFQSGRFRASYSRHHIDFVTPYRTLPHVSVWSLSGTQSRIPTKKISPSLKGFDVDLEREGVTVGNSLSWIATDTHIKKPKQLCPCYTQTGLDKKALAYMSERRSIITPLTASPVHEGDQLLRPKSPPKPVPVLAPPRFSLPLLLPSPNLTVTPPKLTFGGSEPCDTDKEVTDTFVVRNNGSGILVSFIIPSDDRYTLKIDPLQVAIPKGKDVEFKARLTVFCTTTIDAQFGMIAADHKTGFMSHRKTLSDSEATFCNSIGLRITTCLSTQIDYTDLIFEESIGQGSFAAVWKGSWRHTPVAIKLLKNQNPTEESFAEFKSLREIKVLTQLRHTHIVNFIGAVTIPLKLCIITEYMALGNLSSVLIKNQDLAWVIKLKIAKDIALAMSFLHANHIVHRDLKPDNILMVSINKHCDITCKVSDFGTSRAVSSRGMTAASPEITVSALRRMTVLIGTPIYMAPEILSGTQDYGIETDVFSYGVLLWQIVTGYPPYIRLQDFYTFVMSGKREEIPSETPPEYAKLISDCWHQDPAKRPPFLALGKCLEQLVQLQLL